MTTLLSPPIRSLSLRAPWPWLIANAGKDIENRNWSTPYRGALLIHTSAAKDWEQVLEAEMCYLKLKSPSAPPMPPVTVTFGPKGTRVKHWPDEYPTSCYTILCWLSACSRTNSRKSPWFFGRHGFQLSNVIPLPEPIPGRGHQGIRHPDPAVVQALDEMLPDWRERVTPKEPA